MSHLFTLNCKNTNIKTNLFDFSQISVVVVPLYMSVNETNLCTITTELRKK